MADKPCHVVARLLRQALDSEQLPGLGPIQSRALGRAAPGRRLERAAEWLVSHRGDSDAVELWLTELLAATWRQIRGDICLGPTFAQTVHDIDQATLDALPAHVRHGLGDLAKVAIDHGVPMPDARQFAHALVVVDTFAEQVCEAFDSKAEKPKLKPADRSAARRKLLQKVHPDKPGGSAELVQAVHTLYGAIK